MNNPLASAVAITWKRNAAYGLRLVEELRPEQLVAQPPGLPKGIVMNHPAWILCHLNLYADIAVSLALARPFEDPAEHRYGARSVPVPDAGAYDRKDRMVAKWKESHEAGEAALAAATAELTSLPNPLERWRALHPTVGDMLMTLMVKHESGHLGQLSAWRRACALPGVPM